MNFSLRRRVKPAAAGSLADLYPHDVQLYAVPPLIEIPLEEFEDLAFQRLQLLRIVEQAGLKGPKVYSDEWKDTILADLKKDGLKKFARLVANPSSGQTELDFQARKADHISHFILRLAYCRSEDLRRWFIARELELFRLRFQGLTTEGIKQFLKVNGLTYAPISATEKEEQKSFLLESTAGLSHVQVEKSDFYKVDFVEVSDLVKNRKVFVRKGYAYIPSSELVVCLLTIYRTKLSEYLAYMSRRLPAVDDERLRDLLKNLHNTYTGPDYSVPQAKGNVSLQSLDGLSKRSFPMCMRVLHDTVRTEHHVRHYARLQYGLFLKAIGLSYDDAYRFWREEFTRKLDSDAFEKRYAYNIKHLYGKVGSMVNYTPYSCIKVIGSSVGAGEHHGCPFKHWDQQALKQRLKDYGIGMQGILEISDLAGRGHYQIACGKYFEYTHGTANHNVINHPNQYFEDSQAMLTDGDDKSKKPGRKAVEEVGKSVPKDGVNNNNSSSIWNDDGLDLGSIEY